ncbi:response regulator [Dyella jejuensis]|uniref:histidine kinase n=1 Tax=Dyella jejuensis TaxID=1432009 RepID=A0ABW8JK57_9GAMM
MCPDIQVLVVDDNVATRYAMRRILHKHGYSVLEAGTGTEGMAKIQSDRVDAVLLDVNLPDASGFDIVRHLRATAKTALLPVIHVSAASIATGDLITGLDAGADAYLIHPVDPDVLLATLRTLLRVRDTESALRQSEERFREIFNGVVAPIAVIDGDLLLHETNPAFDKQIGRVRIKDNLGASFAAGQEEVLAALSSALQKQQRWQGALTMVMDGVLRDTHWRIAPYREPSVGIAFVEDVTRHKERERVQAERLDSTQHRLNQEIEVRQKAQSQLFQAQKMDALGKLTGGIAHDFNNLLTSVITATEMLTVKLDSHDTVSAKRFASMVLRSAHNAATLTHRLLAFARQQPLDTKVVDVNANISSLGDLLRRTIGEQIDLDITLAAEPAIAKVDPNQLENAVLNLVINARDALSGNGRITIEVADQWIANDPELAQGRYVVLTVADNGRGIAADVLEKVFEPFFTTKATGQGTGLGLSMVYGFARQSGGIARIESRLDQGTQVHLVLPSGVGESLSANKSAPTPMVSGQGEKILLVEDMSPVRALVAEALTSAGYRCEQASDGASAAQLLVAHDDIRLLFTDIGLPDMRGTQLAQIARQARPALPVLFMTGYSEEAAKRSDLIDERTDIITKPFEVGRLLLTIRRMLSAH